MQNLYVNILALFKIAKMWKQPECPSTGERINTTGHSHTAECYLDIKRNKTLTHISQRDWHRATALKPDQRATHTAHSSTHMTVGRWLPRAGEGVGSDCSGHGVSFWSDENVLELDSCTTLWTCYCANHIAIIFLIKWYKPKKKTQNPTLGPNLFWFCQGVTENFISQSFILCSSLHKNLKPSSMH